MALFGRCLLVLLATLRGVVSVSVKEHATLLQAWPPPHALAAHGPSLSQRLPGGPTPSRGFPTPVLPTPRSAWLAAVADDEQEDVSLFKTSSTGCDSSKKEIVADNCSSSDRKVYFKRGTAGFNNGRIAFEIAVAIAAVTGRTLVIGPSSHIAHVASEFDEFMVWDRGLLEEFINVKFGVGAQYYMHDQCGFHICEQLTRVDFESLPQNVDWDLGIAQDWNGYGKLQFSSDQMEIAKQVFMKGLLYRDEFKVAALQKLESLGLKPGGFVGMHIRRGDFVGSRNSKHSPIDIVAGIVAKLKDLDQSSPLLVATDASPDDEIIQELSRSVKVHLTQDLYAAEDDDFARITEDTLMVGFGKHFIGSHRSSFSEGIREMRIKLHKEDPKFDFVRYEI